MTQVNAAGSPQLVSAPSFVHRYRPLVKTKGGEIAALENLSSSARARITPIFHVCEVVTPSFVPKLATAWAGMLTAVDGSFNCSHTGSPNVAIQLITEMRNKGIPTMPCWSQTDPATYQHAVRAMVDHCGAVIKVSLNDLANVAPWLAQQMLPPSSVDLVVDLKHIGEFEVGSLSGVTAALLNQHTALLQLFRSITLAAGAAPKDQGALMRGLNRITRTDWSLWNAVRPNVQFQLDYGDYLTGHPNLSEPPGAAMAKATVSARYTLDTVWLIIKGFQAGGQNGLPMGTQYHSHAGIIANDPGFLGVPNVWADGQVGLAAVGAPKMASRAKWSGFAANRHMSLVADRLP